MKKYVTLIIGKACGLLTLDSFRKLVLLPGDVFVVYLRSVTIFLGPKVFWGYLHWHLWQSVLKHWLRLENTEIVHFL